jgi:hypothetical protein
MTINLTFSHDHTDRTHIRTFIVTADSATEASELISIILADVYAQHGPLVTVTPEITMLE